jgi:hypothetical protein
VPDSRSLAQRSRARRPTDSSLRKLAHSPSSAAALCLGVTAWGLFAAYLIWRVVEGPVLTWQDTTSYMAVARHPFPSAALLGGARAPVEPLLWKLTGTDTRYALTQTLIAIVAWSVLAATVAWRLRSPWRSLLAGVVVLSFASTWQVIEWDWSVLSESISLSALALMFAAILWLVRRVTLPRAAVFLLASLVYAGARDPGIWVVAMLAVIACALALARLIAGGPRRAARTALIGLALLSIAGVTELGAVSSNRNVINVEDVFDVRVFPFPQRIAWFAARGMPQSAALDSLAASAKPNRKSATVIAPHLGGRQWRALSTWFNRKSQVLYLEYLLTHPGYDVTAPFVSPELTFNDANGNLAFYAGPYTPLPVISTIMFPPGDVIAVLGLLSASLAVARRLTGLAEIRAVVVMAIVGMLAILIAWQGDGMEVARHTIEGNVEVRLAVLVTMLFALLWSPRART